jgi:hypothetical protein
MYRRPLEVSCGQACQFANAASRHQRRLHEVAQSWLARVDQALRFFDGQDPISFAIDPSERFDPSAPSIIRGDLALVVGVIERRAQDGEVAVGARASRAFIHGGAIGLWVPLFRPHARGLLREMSEELPETFGRQVADFDMADCGYDERLGARCHVVDRAAPTGAHVGDIVVNGAGDSVGTHRQPRLSVTARVARSRAFACA